MLDFLIQAPSRFLIALGLLAVPAALGCQDGPGEQRPVDAVAIVNSEAITAGQLSKAMSRARRDNENLSPRTQEDQAAFRAAVLDDLITQTLLMQAAHAAGSPVPAERVDREILRLRADYPGPSFDQALAEGGQTMEELREQTRQRLTVEQYIANQVLSRVAVTDADVEAYFKDHTAEFARPEMVHAEQIVVDDPETAKRILSEARRGERFEELARKYSRSPDARVGGDLGFFSRGQMPDAFDQACFPLKKGELSEVVASPYGFHLFKVLEKRPAGTPALAEVRADVEAKLRKQREEEAQANRLADLRQHAQLHIDQGLLATVD